MYARPLVGGEMINYRIRLELQQTRYACTYKVLLRSPEFKQRGNNVHFDVEALINSIDSWAQTGLSNPPLLFVVRLLAHGCLTEIIIHMSKVDHDVTTFSSTLLCQFTQLWRGLRYQRMTLSNICGFVGAGTPLSCIKKKGQTATDVLN